jgi:arylsulfatase A-like enzyme
MKSTPGTMARLFTAALALVSCLTSVRAADEKLNVLFLFSDDQRADTIHALGNSKITTPNLDKLVQSGVTFTRAYCMGARQGAVCVPSRAMMLSGRTLFRIKEDLEGIDTWPALLGKSGYVTFATGKWHNGQKSFANSFSQGRSIFFGGMSNPTNILVQDMNKDRAFTAKRPGDKHASELFADEAIRFIREAKPGQPFCLYVAFTSPHDPRISPASFRNTYDPAKSALPKNYLPQHPFNNGDMLGRDEQLAPWPRTPEVVQEHLADYYGAITHLDAQIGRILASLDEARLREKTIVVFASDHGLAIGSHGLFGKQNVYEHSMRAPLIVSAPGIPKGKRSDALCYLLDIFPTLFDLLGLLAPPPVEGKSLVGILRGQTNQVRDSIFTAYRHVQRAVRDTRWKLIRYPHINKSQLFDLHNDPDELNDLSANPQHSGELRRMTALLSDWQERLEDKQALTSEKPEPLQIEFKVRKAP